MKKLFLIFAFVCSLQAQAQNIRKGVQLASEPGTAGFNITTGTNNLMIGHNSGYDVTSGIDNVLMGNYSGYNLTTGSENLILGRYSGYSVTTGNANSFLGVNCGGAFYSNSTGNTCVGHYSGFTSTSAVGNQNTFIGNESGYFPPSAGTFQHNTFVGAKSGYMFNGNENTVLGSNTGVPLTGYYGNEMTLIGAGAHNGSSSTLSNATALGANAVVSSSNALVLGNNAMVGIGTSTPNHTLHLKKLPVWSGYTLFSDSRTRPAPNLTCNWDNAAFIVNGDFTKAIIVGKGNTECQDNGPWTETFLVYGNGDGYARGSYIWSDKRFKKDIQSIKSPVEIIKKLQGVSYKISTNLPNDPNAVGTPSYGFIAQEVKKIIPEIVSETKNGFYAVNYDAIIPFLTEAIKEQQKRIEQLEAQIQANKSASPTGFADTKATTFEGGFLAQNVPNPFSAATEIKYQLPKGAQKASIGIYDMNGKEIRLIALSSETSSGAVTIQGGDLQPGMYMYSLLINGQYFDSKKMVLTSQ